MTAPPATPVPVIVLPGMDGSGLGLEAFTEAMGAGFEVRTVAYPPGQPLGYSGLELIARAALPAAGRYIIVAESFSGPLALRIACSSPAGLAGLVLVASFARAPLQLLIRVRWLLRVVPAGMLRWVVRRPSLWRHYLTGRRASHQLHAQLGQALRALHPGVVQARLTALAGVDERHAVAGIGVPMLYLRGTHDRAIPAAVANTIAAAAPDCRVVDVATPHLLLQMAPDEAAEHIRGFAGHCIAMPGTA